MSEEQLIHMCRFQPVKTARGTPIATRLRHARSRYVVTVPASRHGFPVVVSLLFAASVALTVAWCTSMSAMGGMRMPGGWTMSVAWMRMPGQSWPGATASFAGMWVVMMVAMMLPSLVPALWRYRQAAARAGTAHIERLTMLVAGGYFLVWSLFGLAVFPVGAALAALAMQQPVLSRAVPIVSGVAVASAGLFQFTAWKARQLACCREAGGRGHTLPSDAPAAWREGVRLGVLCARCCANLTTIVLVAGVMDLRVMAAVTVAITAERLVPAGDRVVRVMGFFVAAAGAVLIVRSMS